MIIRGGENIYPREIEEFLYTMPGIEDAQVVGVPDAKYGEVVGAFVRLKAGADMTEGEVRKIDKAQSKITLKHAEIKSLDMPPMTMVFNVKDKAVLDSVQPGDKVKFKAVNEAGKFTVTELRVIR